ncbi:Do family serine endopeptidase [Alphaproteobacteria bacterium]|nr:Do family serine endopeptidase [Alphaproteobacteria bacterium]
MLKKFFLPISIFFVSIQTCFANFETGYADLVEKLLPSVVSIVTTQAVDRQTNNVPKFPEGHPFNDMFKDFFENQMPQRENMTALGSGFVISKEGYIVTNHHVIERADKIQVVFSNAEKEIEAILVGSDPKTDLAVLKINPKSLNAEALLWGDSSKSRVGDIVLAIGNPLGLGGTVTSGIISSINRDIGGGPYVDFIQTDAPINRGNSGGPLFNLSGEVIGINSMIISQSGGSVGLGFSIPSSTAKLIVDDLISYGQAKRGWLGVQIQDLSIEFSESLGFEGTEGAFVASVDPLSPAGKAGILAGDIIVEFDSKNIKSFKDLPKVVAETAIGKKVKVKLWRNNKYIEIIVLIDELNEKGMIAQVAGSVIAELDITVIDLDDNKIKELGISNINSGIIVKSVGPKNSNLIQDDIIIQVSSEKVSNVSDFKNIIKENQRLKREKILLKVIRSGNEFWLINPFVIE